MREFDEFEKNLITKIIYFKQAELSSNFRSILGSFMIDRGIEIDTRTNEAWIYFDRDKFSDYNSESNTYLPKSDFIEQLTPTINIIIKIIFLLDYLEKNGLIFLYNFAQTSDEILSHPSLKSKPEPLRLTIPDKKIIGLLEDFFHKEIIISQNLVSLVDDNFCTKEDIRHKKTIQIANESIKVSKEAILISYVIGGFSIIFSIVSLIQSYYLSSKPVEISAEQIQMIQHEIKNKSTELLISKTNNKIDSLQKILFEIKGELSELNHSDKRAKIENKLDVLIHQTKQIDFNTKK